MKRKTISLVHKRANLDFTSHSGLYYLDLRKKSLTLGTTKATVIPYIIKYLHILLDQPSTVPSLLDIGCGEGHLLAHIKKIFDQSRQSLPIYYLGVDFNKFLIKNAKKNYPEIDFKYTDITSGELNKSGKKFDIIMTINTLHEIFSFYSTNGVFVPEKGKSILINSLKKIVRLLKKGGKLVIFDGIETYDDPNTTITIRLKTKDSIKSLIKFAADYKPIKVKLNWLNQNTVEMNAKTFTRFITKIIFINTPVWEMEQEEMYQYFTIGEYHELLKNLGMRIEAMNILSPNLSLWDSHVEIVKPPLNFPYEHIMLIATKK